MQTAFATVEEVVILNRYGRPANAVIRRRPLACPAIPQPHLAPNFGGNRLAAARRPLPRLGRPWLSDYTFSLFLLADDLTQPLLEKIEIGGPWHLVRERRTGTAQKVFELRVRGHVPARKGLRQYLLARRSQRQSRTWPWRSRYLYLPWGKWVVHEILRDRLGI